MLFFRAVKVWESLVEDTKNKLNNRICAEKMPLETSFPFHNTHVAPSGPRGCCFVWATVSATMGKRRFRGRGHGHGTASKRKRNDELSTGQKRHLKEFGEFHPADSR